MAAFGIDRFLNVRAAVGPTFSPDGRFVAFLMDVTGVDQVWQVPVEGGWPVQLTFSDENIAGVEYSPVRHEIIYGIDSGGDELTQLHRLHGVGVADHGLGDGWTADDLTRQPKARHNFGGWSRDGEQIAFTGNREDAGRFDTFVQKIGDDEARRVEKGPGGFYFVLGWSPDDASLLTWHEESNFNHNLFIVDVKMGKSRRITEHKGDAQYEGARWSADGKAVYCVSNADGRDLPGLAKIDVESGKLSYVEMPEHEVGAAYPSPKGRWLAWVVNEGGRSGLYLRDLVKDKAYEAPGLPTGVVGRVEFAPDDGRLAFTFQGPRHNPDVWLWDLTTGGKDPRPAPAEKLRPLTRASRAGLPFNEFVEPESIKYKTFDGRMIPAWWYEPPAAARGNDDRPPPVIVYPHGGPESQTRAGFNAVFQFFLQHGYGVLAPNVRGSTGYGTAYMNLDNTTKRMDAVADFAHAAYWLRDQKKGDPKRLAVYGISYGGFMVLAQLTTYPDLWAAGVDVVGIANFITFLEHTSAYRRPHREAEYGSLKDDREFLEKISPINHVDKIKCPLMVVHGANDPRVPVGEAEQIVAALKKRMSPVEYIRYEDEGHGVEKLKNKLDVYPKIVAFLDKHLK
jgi:dipeptidyl aminopeptidase/acylaminoacyl peptidase